jgi:hypothetical protein
MTGTDEPEERGLWRALVRFWAEPVRAEPIALFRILLAGVGFVSILVSLAPELDLWVGPGGLCPGDSIPAWLRWYGKLSLLSDPGCIPLVGRLLTEEQATAWREYVARPDVLRWAFAAWATSLFLLAVGLYTRTAAVLAWLLTVSFHNRIFWLNNGGDDLLRCGLFYLMFTPSGAVWSLDWLARRQSLKPEQSREPVRIPAWPLRLMQIQICLVYLGTGLVKLGRNWLEPSDWVTGDAAYWVMNDFAVSRWSFRAFPLPFAVCCLMAWATLIFELGFPLVMLSSLVRPWWLLLGVGFHLGVWITMEVGWFSPMSLCWYALFVPGETLARWAGNPKHEIRNPKENPDVDSQ